MERWKAHKDVGRKKGHTVAAVLDEADSDCRPVNLQRS